MKITIKTVVSAEQNDITLAEARAAHKASWEAATEAHNLALEPFRAACDAADKIFAAKMEAADEAVTLARADHADMARAIEAESDREAECDRADAAAWAAILESREAAQWAAAPQRHCVGNDVTLGDSLGCGCCEGCNPS